MQHVFIIGSRGLPASYGGFETFVQELIHHQVSKDISYHVACLSDTEHRTHFNYEGADCFNIRAPKLGPARVIAYDCLALTHAIDLAEKEKMERPIFYILGNTIGAFIGPFARKIHKIGGLLFVNPDGLEWKRSKWSRPVQSYLKYSEGKMAQHADLILSDNLGIEQYIKQNYPYSYVKTIEYGTDTNLSSLTFEDAQVRDYFAKWGIEEEDYYLILGRFVPENNYEAMISAFIKSDSKRDLVIVTNHEGSAFYDQLKKAIAFDQDPRIKFVGTLYDKELVKYLRNHAFAYLHGHEVGGTNPGLLEAMAQTDLNLVLGVDFNTKVAMDTVLYWTKDKGNLDKLLRDTDKATDVAFLGKKAKERIAKHYTWPQIVARYEELFLK